MAGRLLSFSQYIGGANNVVIAENFPSTQKTYNYNFPTDISTYSFAVESQTIVVDSLTYNAADGQPNFTNTNVVGTFANVTVASSNVVPVSNAAGTVNITIPANLYGGPIEPDARANVPINVLSVTWTDSAVTPNITESHRYALIQRYEPGVTVGNPRLSNAFISIGTGAISTFTGAGTADGSRTAGTYSGITGVTSGPSASTGQVGSGATFQALVLANGVCEFDILTRGTDYVVGDTINILDSSLGGGGGADITITVTATG
tara:strand:- start:325 stop:1110 length:786 start_codon:yes stop_codon:yes gene_type:complete